MRKAEESKSDSRAQHPYTLATAPLRTAEESLCRPSLGAPVSGLQGLCPGAAGAPHTKILNTHRRRNVGW